MKVRLSRLTSSLVAVALVGGLAVFAPAEALATDPVTVAVEVSGTPAPGAAVTAKATVTINDGSALQGIAWSQAKGAAATLAGAATDTVTVTLGNRAAFRAYLMHVLREPALTAAQLPPNVPVPEEHFPGGMPDRFQVVGINPHAAEDAAVVVLDVAVTTTSGTYHHEAEIHVALPFKWTTGIRNVPVGVPVLLYGPEQASYSWAMTVPPGSAAALVDATTQSPEFTPDAPGAYTVTVTDLTDGSVKTFAVQAGLWRGVITGQDGNGRPVVDTACTGCHAPNTPLDQFTPWKATGHAEIFTQNVNNPAGHYSTNCIDCHTVGYNPDAANNGIDDQPNWQAFLDSGMLTHGAADNWTHILEQFPDVAKQANIQCENCHGPQNSDAHAAMQGQRVSLSSDMCASCHGEPPRHGRFQQWQLSGHANYELAGEEGMSGSCAKCHTGNGFLAWEKKGFGAGNVTVDWTPDEVHPQTCQTCHDPHDIGTSSGSDATNATVRIDGDTPMLDAGFVATDLGKGALCATCHNGRRGLRNDSNFSPADGSRAPHVGPQTDILMGQNLYFVEVGTRSYHAMVEDSCVTCHMDSTPPPDIISYNKTGTNHTFYASKDICADCHTAIDAEGVQGEVEAKMEHLKAEIEAAILDVMAARIGLGDSIDLGGLATVTDIGQIQHLELTESHGRQGIAVTLAGGSALEAVAMNSVKAVPAAGAGVDIYRLAHPNLAKAGWNYFMTHSDASHGVHNPNFVMRALDLSIFAVKNLPAGGGSTGGAVGGGPGNGAGAVACTTPFVYWAEIAANLGGENGSRWKTDIVARNLSASAAAVKFVLHTESGNVEATSTVPGAGQGVFEDLVGLMGVETKGSLEVCSDRPLMMLGRIFNQAETGTFGQFLDGHVADLGMSAGQSAYLLGLRQEAGRFRTNLSVTNGGTETAEVEVTWFDNDGEELGSYDLSVGAGKVYQDLQPLAARAGLPDAGWAFAQVTVLSGTNVQTSASVIDAVTNDATTVPAKR